MLLMKKQLKELINRSKETLIKEKEAVALKLKELGVEDNLIKFKRDDTRYACNIRAKKY